MIIFLPTRIRQTGGSSTFANKLQLGMAAAGHNVIFKWVERYDVLLVNASCPLRYLIHAIINHRLIVQRLDGVYYPMSVAGKNYRLANLPVKLIYRLLADRIIYQSNYSRYCAELFLGGSPTNHNNVIYNGVDAVFFSPSGENINLRDNPEQQIFITASRFRRKDQILPLLDAFSIYREKFQSNSKLIVIGDLDESLHMSLPDLTRQSTARNLIGLPVQTSPPAGGFSGRGKTANDIGLSNVQFLGPLNNDILPAYLRSADAFLFTHLNPPCPNNIIEAMACGLPIAGVADGAMPEICVPGQNAELIPAAGSGFWQPRHLDLRLFASNMAKIMQQRDFYASKSRQIALARFQLSTMIEKYMGVFQNGLNKSKIQSSNVQPSPKGYGRRGKSMSND